MKTNDVLKMAVAAGTAGGTFWVFTPTLKLIRNVILPVFLIMSFGSCAYNKIEKEVRLRIANKIEYVRKDVFHTNNIIAMSTNYLQITNFVTRINHISQTNFISKTTICKLDGYSIGWVDGFKESNKIHEK